MLQIIPLLASRSYRRHLKRGIAVKILLAFIIGAFYESVLIFYDLGR